MSTETKRAKGKQVSATVSPELYEALDEYGWQNRKKRTDLVRQAVEEFAARNNILPAEDEGSDTKAEFQQGVDEFTLPQDNDVPAGYDQLDEHHGQHQ